MTQMLQTETLEVSHGQAVSGGTFLTIAIVKTSFQWSQDEMQPSGEKFSSKNQISFIAAPETWVAYGSEKEGAGYVFTPSGRLVSSLSPDQFLKMGENRIRMTFWLFRMGEQKERQQQEEGKSEGLELGV